MLSTFFRAAVVATVTLCVTATTAMAQDFKVIVNSANATSELPGDVAAKLFLKQSLKFPGGTAAQPVDQVKGSPVRASFSKAVLGRPVAAVETFWQQQIFAGKEVPPPAKASDDEVIAYVKANPGAIGYVSAGAATAGVKVVDIK
jgi:ABC-type phosphate transport system substrate-binding protein